MRTARAGLCFHMAGTRELQTRLRRAEKKAAKADERARRAEKLHSQEFRWAVRAEIEAHNAKAKIAPISPDMAERVARLSPTEREVLRRIAAGKSTKEIAAERHGSTHTVDTHRKGIKRKLGTSDVATLTRIAVRHGV